MAAEISPTGRAVRLNLAAARKFVDRGMAMGSDFAVRGTFSIVDEAGYLITQSRMQGASAAGPGITKGKAILAALHQEPSSYLTARMNTHMERFHAFHRLFPDMYPGPGGMFIRINGRIVGGFASGTGFGPLRYVRGIDPHKLFVNGDPVNLEDLITAYALGINYRDFHAGIPLYERNAGEVTQWNVGERLWGEDPADQWVGVGHEVATMTHKAARAIADAGLRTAGKVPISIAVYDEVGIPMQIDRMDFAAPATADVAAERARVAFETGSVTAHQSALLTSADGTPYGSVGVATAGAQGALDAVLDAAKVA